TRSKRDWSSDVCSSDLGRIEAHHGHEQAYVAFCQRFAKEVAAPVGETPFECVELSEHLGVGFIIGLLAGSETRLINTIIEVAIEHGRASCRGRGGMQVG